MPNARCAAVAVVVAALASVATAAAQSHPTAATGRVLFLVDRAAFPELRSGLETYARHIRAEFRIDCIARPDDYLTMSPTAIRKLLHDEYRAGSPPLVGAILIGALPHALRGDPNELVLPLTLFYEDFDAVYTDRNGDGVYQESEIANDRLTNPTEIWTAWWIPPALEAASQIKLLQGYLEKLDRYHRGELPGRDQMLWLAGNVQDVEICEGWTVLLKDALRPLDQRLRIWCRVGQDEGTFRPNKRKDEFTPRDFIAAFTLQTWQHAHIITHGNGRGWYWDGSGVVGAAPSDGRPEAALVLDLAAFHGAGAQIVTTSGCSNGNFRGDGLRPDYDRALGNLLLFSPHTNTIAYYGAASPQSTSGFAGYCTELIESLSAGGGSYLAAGYQRMRNQDYSWGTQHFFFRGGDEKVLLGDPFARYRDSAPLTNSQDAAIEQKLRSANWTVVGPG